MDDPLSTFTHDTFAGLVGERFAVPAAALELVLTEAEELGGPPGAARPTGGFSLVFQGPPDPVLDQATYALEHEGLGEFPLFLVPIGRTGDRTLYQAIFN